MPEMQGATARWYARQRGSRSQLESYRTQAAQFVRDLPEGASVLEVAPGPGYLAIEMARTSGVRVSGLDVSESFVRIAGENARRAGAGVEFRHGDAAAMPFEANSFDLLVCQAAFKNFTEPRHALDEMHRVLRSGRTAVIEDMRKDVSVAEIDDEVRRMELGGISALMTKLALVTLLRRRAYTVERLRWLVQESAFHGGEITTDGITVRARLTKQD
jgi:ubiquinone/menaquinone biosynthesis C-methylase UbiE